MKKNIKKYYLGIAFSIFIGTFAVEKNKTIMDFEDISIRQLAKSQDVTVDYSDDDIVIIDNIKTLVEPTATQLKMNLMVICTAGKAQGLVNGQLTMMECGNVFICPPNIMFSDFLMSHDFEFKAMFFTTHILRTFLREKISIWNECMYIQRTHIVTMNENDANFFNSFYDLLKLCMDDHPYEPFRTEVIQALLQASLMALCGRMKLMLSESQSLPNPRNNQASNLFRRFLNLLENEPVKHRTVESYAAELCITPKYLSSVCKKQSGKTTNEWIKQQVVASISYHLKHTDLTIKQICDRLGFPNTSFFGKYVREHFGMTPKQLRNS